MGFCEIPHARSQVVRATYCETISFLLVHSPSYPIILDYPWLSLQYPVLDWGTRELTRWGEACTGRCLKLPTLVAVTGLKGLPAVYNEFADIFQEKTADLLPPHRNYDCPIDLIPGAKIPK